MEELLINPASDTGPCQVDIEKVVNAWNDKFCICQWHEEYRLIEYLELFKESAYKVEISKDQALKIIERLKLLPIISFFAYAKTWRTESNIISEKNRMQKILDAEKSGSADIPFLIQIIGEFDSALTAKK